MPVYVMHMAWASGPVLMAAPGHCGTKARRRVTRVQGLTTHAQARGAPLPVSIQNLKAWQCDCLSPAVLWLRPAWQASTSMNDLRVRLQGQLTAGHVTVAGRGPPPTLALPLPPSPSVQDAQVPQLASVLSQGFHDDLQDNVTSGAR